VVELRNPPGGGGVAIEAVVFALLVGTGETEAAVVPGGVAGEAGGVARLKGGVVVALRARRLLVGAGELEVGQIVVELRDPPGGDGVTGEARRPWPLARGGVGDALVELVAVAVRMAASAVQRVVLELAVSVALEAGGLLVGAGEGEAALGVVEGELGPAARPMAEAARVGGGVRLLHQRVELAGVR